MKKRGIFLALFMLIMIIRVVSPTMPTEPPRECYNLPEIVYEFKDYYEEVQINDSECYPSYSFMTPTSYSNFKISHSSRYLPYVKDEKDIQTYDNRIKQIILAVENCSGFKGYYKLMIEGFNADRITMLSYFAKINSLDNVSCNNLSKQVEGMKNLKKIDVFLRANTLGDYDSCRVKSGSTSYNDENTDLSTNYIVCDGERERLSLDLQDGKITRAYFLNHKNEPYREVYPEDIKLKRRSTVWENPIKNFLIDYFLVIIMIFLVIIVALFIFLKKDPSAP
jgi:hypothetical protein